MNKFVRSSKTFLNRNASTILTCIGGAGVIATAVLAAKATPKAMRIVEAAEILKDDELTTVEKIKVAGPTYIPAIAVGVGTIACIFGANAFNKRQQAAIVSAYTLLDSSYKEYKNKVTDLYGEEFNATVREEIAKDKYKEADIEVKDNKELFYDEFSGRYFESTIEDVQRAEYRINRDLVMRDYVYLNEFYEHLGIPPIDAGDTLGWSKESCLAYYWQEWIDFSHSVTTMDDGLKCRIVTMFTDPVPDFEDYA